MFIICHNNFILFGVISYTDLFTRYAAVKVIYETDDKDDAETNTTKIRTDHFQVNITVDGMNKTKATVEQVKGTGDILEIGEPLVRNDDGNDVKTTKENVPQSVQDTLKNALINVIIDKLKDGDLQDAEIKNSVPVKKLALTAKEEFSKKRDVTDMFVRFLEDLSKKLNVDVVTVAEQLISRSSEKPDDMDMEMNAGFARDTIPKVPVEFKSIIKLMSNIVRSEMRSARYIGFY